jgi:DnaK suppressor protein
VALTETARAELRRLLAEDRDRTAEQLASLERTFAELVAAADLEPPDDEHDPDGTTAYERAQITSLAAEARIRLATLDESLTTDPATLGTCTTCGGEIPWPRLLAIPATRSCITCATTGRT